MKKILLLCSLFGLLYSFQNCGSAVETDKKEEFLEYYKGGAISRQFYRINDKIEGEMKDYYIDGSLKSIKVFENDKQVGLTRIFYEDGSIKEVQYYENGMKQGGDTIFYQSGKPQFTSYFEKGLKNGYLRKWSEEGDVTYEANYRNDTLVEVNGEAIIKDHLLQ